MQFQKLLAAVIFIVSSLLCVPTVCCAYDYATILWKGTRQELTGRTLVEAQDGGIVFESRDRKIWAAEPNNVLSLKRNGDAAFEPFDRREITAALLADLPAGFQIFDTDHYIIAHNTSLAYAQWCGALYERLHKAFTNFWQHRGLTLHETPPLVAVVFQDRQSFEAYGKEELGDAVKAVIGFYSLHTNRITTYDLTGVDQARGNSRALGTPRKINQALLANPEAERTVATVIHEATHQLVFNSGMQQRFADIPVWLSEGLAIYFETPDLGRSRGWATIGAKNQVRLGQMKRYTQNRPAHSLKSLIVDNARFRDTRTAETAYAEAWSLCYFLRKQSPKQFDQYMRLLQKKPTAVEDSPHQRLDEFEATFGSLDEIEPRFMKMISNLR
ncbi:MAG: DUF1570 domain-containing protein [Planctomycetales bacterium]|nr:DUF1570 domain-containing protein [Planctomycetales bacterium]